MLQKTPETTIMARLMSSLSLVLKKVMASLVLTLVAKGAMKTLAVLAAQRAEVTAFVAGMQVDARDDARMASALECF